MMQRKFLALGLSLAVGAFGIGLVATSASAVTTSIIPASADTHVDRFVAGQSHGDLVWLATCPSRCHGIEGSERRAVVRFDVPSHRAGSKYELQLTPVMSYTASFSVHPGGSNWKESDLTWDSLDKEGKALDSASLKNSAKPLRFDVTSVVTKSGKYSFVVRQSAGPQVSYFSNQAVDQRQDAPKLVVSRPSDAPVAVPKSPTKLSAPSVSAPTPVKADRPTEAAPTPVGSTNGPLPMALPSQGVLKGSSKKVFAHYFTPYPLSLDNRNPDNDYYARNYLKPDGERGKYAAAGGLLRDRPIPSEMRAAGSRDYILENLKKEVAVASAAGLDGFTVDVLSVSSRNWEWTKQLIKAAEQTDRNFKIVLMPDMYSMDKESAGQIAAAMASVAKSPNVYKLDDGRLVIAPFKAEARSADWWAGFLKTMQNKHGQRVAFVPTFLNFQKNAREFAPISYGFGNWGNRNPAHNENLDDNIKLAHSLGKIWMQPVSVQDSRPNQSIFDEANNTENLRVTWEAAIKGADWVQIPTWNDYSEGAQLWSLHNGYTYLDISSYYLTWFKAGKAPRITNDVLYVTHRVQPHAAKPVYNQRKMMKLRGGSSKARDTVEVLSFLKAPGTVTAKIGNRTHTYEAPAGVFSKVLPLQTGTVSASLKRDGKTIDSVTSPWTVKSRPYVQDLQYYGVTSGRN